MDPKGAPDPGIEPWTMGPREPVASREEVHVWRLDLDPPGGAVPMLRTLLSPAECERADRYMFPHLTRRYIAGQGALRLLLSRYTGLGPEALTFFKGPVGKPYLSPALNRTRLQFNVSNSGERALVAVTVGREVGVDLEAHRGMTYGASVAERHFAPAELQQMPPEEGEDWQRAFFNCWTRKEAFIKLSGDGLRRPLDSFEVSLRPGDPPEVRWADGVDDARARYALFAFDPEPGYTAALIVEGQRPAVRLWDFSA